jgi:hypothetical protein
MEEKKVEIPFTLKEKIQSLADLLLAQNPGFAAALNEIHKMTNANPEYVYALSDEQFRTIVSGYGRYTKITIDIGAGSKKRISKEQAAALDEDSV